ncbi:ChaN family lipoprotein [Photobacterium damselae]|uniref:ChaN family lipoprotein n=1 Tax=Photobacterium damselae TaxID=38293 RepID=UPI0025426FF9|nr:ChaN family lipoprotein [Photobacterium damselae]WIH20072.1 ChaN family lipoprotein [Photobacterium damselae]
MKAWLSLTIAALLTGCATTPQPSSKLNTFYDYRITDSNHTAMTVEQLAKQLENADVVLVGEWHGHPAAHLLQAQLLAALYQQNADLTLSMEQFTRDKQGVLNDYLAGKIGESTLTKEANAWPNYTSDYRPLVEFAKQNQLDVLAANAPKSIVRCIGQQGGNYLNKLPKNERQWVASKLTLSNDAYKQKFKASMHHGDEAKTERQFAAQTAWDDTMAESIVNYLVQHPDHQIMHTAGRFHVMDGLGTASRIKARNPKLQVALVTPVTKNDDVTAGSIDYRVEMMSLPKSYVQKDKMMAAMKMIQQRNSNLKCY